jgi:hypothetical protein
MSFFVQRVVAHLQENGRYNLDNSLTSVKKGACFKTSPHYNKLLVPQGSVIFLFQEILG